MNRAQFLASLGLGIFAPKFGRWHKQGSGLLVPDHSVVLTITCADGNVLRWVDARMPVSFHVPTFIRHYAGRVLP